MKVSRHRPSRKYVKVFDGYYHVAEEGYSHPMPILHFTGVDDDGQFAHVPVEGFLPYFCVPREAVTDEVRAELANDTRVLAVREDGQSMRGDPLVKIVLHTPYHTPDVAETFETTYESDVTFVERAMIDIGFHQAISVPSDADLPYDVSVVEVADDHAVADRRPHIVYFDLEVEQTDEGAAVVSETGTSQARNRIFAISAYSNYGDEQETWVLRHRDWDATTYRSLVEDDGVRVCDDERSLLLSFCATVSDWSPTMLSGWNSQSFDAPYLVNRCLKREVYDIYDLSPTGDVSKMDGDGQFYNHDLKGIVLFDMLDGYDKTVPSRLDSYALEAVAEKELDGMEKLDVDEQTAWREDPEQMIEYVDRDTEAVVAINEEVGIA